MRVIIGTTITAAIVAGGCWLGYVHIRDYQDRSEEAAPAVARVPDPERQTADQIAEGLESDRTPEAKLIRAALRDPDSLERVADTITEPVDDQENVGDEVAQQTRDEPDRSEPTVRDTGASVAAVAPASMRIAHSYASMMSAEHRDPDSEFNTAQRARLEQHMLRRVRAHREQERRQRPGTDPQP